MEGDYKMSEKRSIWILHRKKIMNFVYVMVIFALILATVNNASAAYGNRHHSKLTPTPIPVPTPKPTSTPVPTPTPVPITTSTGDTIRVYRSATGQIDVLNIEMEYLPYVVAAENDIAPFESMKVQAIASRTYAYYKKENPGGANFDVYDDSRDQNYKPWLVLTDNLKNSVSQTNGIVFKWGGVIICSFYVSGSGDTATYVTYNEGKSGEAIIQSSIGWITNPASLNPYNRGAMGQIQANALANNGYTWQNILKYFYGNDIIIASK
jgi:peptidoglycan hydrolase-like amidase